MVEKREELVALAALTRTQFVVQMILCYARIYPEITTTGAMARAAETFRAFLSDEKIEFGDARYAWDSAGAANIVYGYEGVDLPKPLSSRDDGETKSSDGVPGKQPASGAAAAPIETEDAGVASSSSEAPSTIPADVPAMKEALISLQAWCDEQGAKLGAVDGYNYHSGEEYAYRSTAIEIGKRIAAISRLDVPSKTAGEYYVVRKNGYFYRPKAQGYTSSVHEAGLWPKDEAEKYAIGVEGVTVHPASEWPAPAAEQGVAVSVDELADFIVDLGILMADDDCWDIARALLDKYSIRSAMMTEGE